MGLPIGVEVEGVESAAEAGVVLEAALGGTESKVKQLKLIRLLIAISGVIFRTFLFIYFLEKYR